MFYVCEKRLEVDAIYAQHSSELEQKTIFKGLFYSILLPVAVFAGLTMRSALASSNFEIIQLICVKLI